MEHFDNLIDPIEVTPNMSESWKKMGNWAYFFSVLGIIAIFILILCFAAYNFAVFEVMRNAAAPGRIAPYPEERISTLRWTLFFSDLIFLLSIGFFFMIQRAHFLFANGIESAVRSLQQQQFESVWRHLRNHFRFYGLFMIAMLLLFFTLLVWSTLYIKAPNYY